MKLKPIYIYSIVIIIAVVVIAMFSSNIFESENPAGTSDSQMPNDATHQSMRGKMPSGENVDQTAMQKLQQLEKEVEANPNDTLKMKKLSTYYAIGHQKEKAITLLEKVLAKGPDRLDILQGLTYLEYMQKNFSKAEFYNNKVYKLTNGSLESQLNIAVIEEGKGNTDKAKNLYQSLIKKNPNTEVAKMAQSSLDRLNSPVPANPHAH
ncbi:MAG: tetratricopeptide repeat protein [Melioribacteraceae bacterium]|nr:tetratricopeptide repeat protein [Melioribacteraceae bacterium]